MLAKPLPVIYSMTVRTVPHGDYSSLNGLRSPACRRDAQSSKQSPRTLKRTDIASERKGGYLFRHTLATEMLGRGASLGEIGEVLRHRKADTTWIYAKVDFGALRKLAQPWPGGD